MKTLHLEILAVGMISTWASSCSTPVVESDAEFQEMLEAAPSRDLVYKGDVSFARMPLAAGQWAEYLVVDGERGPMRMRLEVIAKEGESFRVRCKMVFAAGEKDSELLVKAFRDSTARDVELPAASELEGDPEEQLGSGRTLWFLAQGIRTRVTADRPLAVTVPAGTFENAVKRRLTVETPESAILHEWLSDKVPIGGVVKAETEDGAFRQVLLDVSTGKE